MNNNKCNQCGSNNLIALVEKRIVWGNELTYPANPLAEKLVKLTGQKTFSSWDLELIQKMGIKVMTELEYYKQQAGMNNPSDVPCDCGTHEEIINGVVVYHEKCYTN